MIGVPHADFGEGVTAVWCATRAPRSDEASVLKALDGRLAKFKMPKRVFVVDELPRNAMGKVQKNILRDTYKDIYSKIGAHADLRRIEHMDRDQAAEILEYLLEAAHELDEARAATAVLADRDEDAAEPEGVYYQAQFRAAAGDV